MKARLVIGVLCLGGTAATVMTPVAAATLEEALMAGKAKLDVRYRYEHVDQSNSLKNAEASTVRSRLGYGSGEFHRVSA